MNQAEIYCQLANIQGLFSIAYIQNRMVENAAALFAEKEPVAVCFPEMSTHVKGRWALLAYLKERQALREHSSLREIPIFHTPSYQIRENRKEALVAWDAYSYCIDTAQRSAVFHTTQFHALCVLDHGSWKYQRISWEERQAFVPQQYQKLQTICHEGQDEEPEAAFGSNMDPADYLTVRNTHHLLAIKNWQGTADLFSPSGSLEAEGLTGQICGQSQIQKWLDSISGYEKKGNGCYRCLQLLGPGYIRLHGENQSRGTWIGQTFEVTPASSSREQTIQRRICLYRHTFERREGSWKILHYHMHTLFELPLITGSGTLYQRMSCPESNWIPISYQPGVSDPLAAFEVETLYALWPASLRRGELMAYFRNHIDNPGGYRISIRSRGPKTPALSDYNEVKTKLEGMDAVYINHQPSYHCASTPVMEISQDAKLVRASWIDHSITNMSQAFGIDPQNGRIPYMIFVSRYDHTFQKLGGKWFLTQFNWEPGLGFPNWYYDPLKTRGWSSREDDEKYPLPLSLEL